MVIRRSFLVWLAIVGTVAFFLASYRHFGRMADGDEGSFLEPFVSESTAALGAGLLFFAVRFLVRRFPPGRRRWWRWGAVYLIGLPVFSAAHTTLNWGLREAAYRLVGFGDYDYGIMPWRYAMEFGVDVEIYAIFIAAVLVVDSLRAAREREVRTAQLESSLARAEVQNLRLQLQPHFLFNALNTISSTMYDDPAAADEMLDRLAELLRASLKTAKTDEVPLEQELELLDCYLALLTARFGERIRFELDVDPAARVVAVPPMLLQPLVENAVRHGNAERLGHGEIAVRGRLEDGELVLEVEDDGPGPPPDRDPLNAGLGLQATAERLELLYGGGYRLATGKSDAGGFRVTITIPAKTSEGGACAS